MSGVGIVNTPPTLTQAEINYLISTFQQFNQLTGLQLTYLQRFDVGVDNYNQAQYSFTPQTIYGVLTDISNEEFPLVEPGFLPTQYSVLWEYQIQPNIGDRVQWESIQWEIRGVYPVVISTGLIYYKTLIRRIVFPANVAQYSGGNN